MNIRDIVFEPHNDMHAGDAPVVKRHENLIKEQKYDDAAALLKESSYKKGFQASLFNSIQNKIRGLEIYLLNGYAAEHDELYSLEEPAEEQMEGRNFWIQIY